MSLRKEEEPKSELGMVVDEPHSSSDRLINGQDKVKKLNECFKWFTGARKNV